MIKKIICILIPACMSVSVAVADALPSNPISLSSEQMDGVTAGLGAFVEADAGATGDYYAVSGTNVVTQISATPGGHVEIAGGAAVAAAGGTDPMISANVTAVTYQPPGSNTGGTSINFVSPNLIIQANLIITGIPG